MIKENLVKRDTQYTAQIRRLAYERLKLQRRIDEIDKLILQLEGALQETEQVKNDIATQEAVDKAKAEAKPPD